MTSSELFSHRYQPEVRPGRGDSTEPVPLPVFSDRPQRGEQSEPA